MSETFVYNRISGTDEFIRLHKLLSPYVFRFLKMGISRYRTNSYHLKKKPSNPIT